ncbi:MAG TPA: tetratricopeptide repeat protein, partial [Streptosporangiaceae bacterium]|nr:tetratricopeptide repeat protein [Streptosporangiaceae bacterium]
TIREYALLRLHGSADWGPAHRGHAAYFLAFAGPTAAERQGRGQLRWLDRLEAEHGNLWAAMSWLVDNDQIESAIRLFWVTWRFWWLRGHMAELARFEENFVAGSGHLPPYQHALALTGTGFVHLANGNQAQARQLFEQSLPLYRRAREQASITMKATVLGFLGRISALGHDYDAAVESLHASQALLDEAGDSELAADDRIQHLLTTTLVHNFLGQIRLSQGDHDSAERYFTEGLTAGQETADRISLLVSFYDLALGSQAGGEPSRAAGFLRQGLKVAAEAGDETSVAYYLENLAVVARQQGDPERAVRLLGAATAMLEVRGSGWLHAYVPRAAHDEALADLRSRLDDAAFRAAWTWGDAAAGARVVEYAQQEQSRRPLSRPPPARPSAPLTG